MRLMHPVQPAEWWRHTTIPLAARDAGAFGSPAARGSDNPAPFWALMAFTFVLLIAPQSFIPGLARLHIAFIAAALAGMLYVVDRLRKHQPVLGLVHEVKIAICLAVWAIVTTPLSIWPGGSVAFLFSIYIKALVIFWLLGRLVDSESRLRSVAWVLSLIAIPLALSAVRSFFSGGFANQALSHGLDRIAGYQASLTGNPNDLALMLNLILPLTIALMFAAHKPAPRILLLAIIGLDVAAIVATYSRGGFLTLGVIIVSYMWLLIRRHQHKLVLLVVALMLASAPLLPSSYLHRLSTITNIEADRTGSAQERWGGSVAAVEYIAFHPLTGAGIGMNVLALNKVRGATWIEVHDIYLVYAVELGVPGLVMFLVLLWGAIKSARTAGRLSAMNMESADLHYLAEGIGVSLIAFAVAAFFYPDAYQFYFYYIAGLAVAAKSICMSGATHPAAAQDGSKMITETNPCES